MGRIIYNSIFSLTGHTYKRLFALVTQCMDMFRMRSCIGFLAIKYACVTSPTSYGKEIIDFAITHSFFFLIILVYLCILLIIFGRLVFAEYSLKEHNI